MFMFYEFYYARFELIFKNTMTNRMVMGVKLEPVWRKNHKNENIFS